MGRSQISSESRCRWITPCGCWVRSRARSTTRTRARSCIGTSSRRTSSWGVTATSSFRTSASRACSKGRCRGSRRPARSSGRRNTWRRNRPSGESAGPAADRYALAVVAYEMLVGAVPYSADTPLATLLAHLHKPLPLPRERNPQLSTRDRGGPAARPREGSEGSLRDGRGSREGDRDRGASAVRRAVSEPARPRPPSRLRHRGLSCPRRPRADSRHLCLGAGRQDRTCVVAPTAAARRTHPGRSCSSPRASCSTS